MDKNKIQKEVEDTFSSLDGLKRAVPTDDFEKDLGQKLSFLPTPRVSGWMVACAAAMLLLVSVNFAALKTFESDNETTDQEYVEQLAEDMLYQPDQFIITNP